MRCIMGGSIINAPNHEVKRENTRLGLETAAWMGLIVENATYINYDRNGMIAFTTPFCHSRFAATSAASSATS